MMSAVCPVNRLTHDWNNGLACRWCDATRTPGEAIVSGLASRRGGTADSARALLDAYRAEVLAEAAAHADRGHVMTDARARIHAMVNLGEVGEYVLDQRLDALVAEVRRMDAAHLLDQRRHHIHRAIFCDGIEYSARLLGKRADEIAKAVTAPAATATPEPSAAEQSEYIVQCVRDAGSMYEADARSFLAEHDGHVRAAALVEVTAWLVKKAREFHASSRKREREQGDTCAVLASRIARGAVRPDNLRMPAEAGFFEVDRTYRREHHGQPITFKVEAISTSPDGRSTVAHGWRTGLDFDWEPTDSDDLTGWTDVTEGGGSR